VTSSADRSGAAAARVVSTDAAGLPALDLERIARVLERILRDHGKAGCLSLAWVDDAAMRALHRDFLADDTPTDVLSFALADEDDSSSAGRRAPRIRSAR
jgi:ssRNA-specific RNase YbeY (16S rRNA maturation enzyme)